MNRPELRPKEIWTARDFSKRQYRWIGRPIREVYHHGTIIDQTLFKKPKEVQP